MKRILFVDDEPRVLEGIENMLFAKVHDWDMTFATSGQQALEYLASERYDVLVTDMRMPGMSGDELLQQCHDRHPAVIRVVLSGYAELDALLTVLPLSHQFFTKPCSGAALREGIERIVRLNALLAAPRLPKMMSGLNQVPCPARSFAEATELLASDNAPLTELARIAEGDVVVAMRLVQFANSAFFAGPTPSTSVYAALHSLGSQLVRDVILALEASRPTSGEHLVDVPDQYTLDGISRHSLLTAQLACRIAPPELRERAFLTGHLQGIGHVVMLSSSGSRWREAIDQAEHGRLELHACETKVFGTSHAEFSAALLGMWGFEFDLLEAVANHHTPSRSLDEGFSLTGILHVADALASCPDGSTIALDYIASVGKTDALDGWRSMAGGLRELGYG
ncbi:MAG: HD-like signal output (HDOD) protein [Myxococcota bacterium]|jgi:HD-like signal output (HDOD) protein